jgi:hypothetical protein
LGRPIALGPVLDMSARAHEAFRTIVRAAVPVLAIVAAR